MRLLAGLSVILFSFAGLAPAQGGRPSPPGTAQVELKGKEIKIDYSRPSMRGRKIMGGLVPYGEVWRTGANEATLLTTGEDLLIGDTKIPTGKYTLFTLPGDKNWKLIINKQTGQSGLEYNQAQDLARVDMTKSTLSTPVEQFTIKLEKTGPDAANLIMEWENTRVAVPVRTQ